jgi:stearoyl-CoA desaturase (Delta-9 desaturase)
LFQGSSYLTPRAYAILHREHHAFSDTARDPHSPHNHRDPFTMMHATYLRYHGILFRTIKPEARFEGNYPEWPTLERIGDSWISRVAWGTAYTLVYIAFAPHWAFFVLLPAHYMMGPIHGAIVNWAGHKIGYRNFETGHGDKSRNTLMWDFLLLGELFQNNHHKYPMSATFAKRWFEIDPSYPVIRLMHFARIIRLRDESRKHRAPKRAPVVVAPALPTAPAPMNAAIAAPSPFATAHERARSLQQERPQPRA